jgi:hypothetical protein
VTAIRTIEYTASPSGVKPIAPQDAGVRGEHKATNVVFNLDASLIKPEYKYRFEYVDGFSGFDTTEFVQPVGSTVSILLPVEWTAGGGCGTLRLCIVALDSQSNEEQTIYTFPASLLFAERETGGECNYKKGLSALIAGAGAATDAANEAAESANAAADKVDESVSSANTAAANANRAAASADASAATASAAAGGAQEAKEAADTAASGANTAAEQARTAAASANTAAGTADTAASNANAVADAVQAKLDAGELKGEKGDTGPEGPQGVSGVYVGGGDMPEGYTVQVDPTGDMLCYTAGESDDRYANVLTGTASGPVAALEDVSPTGALRRAAVLGATAETGSGDKGPDNPYTLAGVQPTKVTVCGRNLAANPRFNAVDQFSPCVYADCELQPNTKYTISLYVPAGEAYYTNENLFAKIVYLPVSTGGIYSAEATTKPTISNTDPKQYATGKGWTLLKTQSGTTASGNARDLQIEFGDTATPYEPYTGQTITLPALASLYGDGTVCDEYDVVSGVETRRWKRVVFDGTENWGLSRTESGNNRYFIRVPDAVAYNLLSQIVCSHWPSIGPGQTWQDKTGITLSLGNADKNIWIYDPRFAQADLPTFKAWLAAQYAAGTPVTVVYQLDAPAVTQHDPARILPPAPVCRVFADAGGVDVGYNRDINIAFEQQQAEYIAQIKALDARIAKLETGQPAEPMT